MVERSAWTVNRAAGRCLRCDCPGEDLEPRPDSRGEIDDRQRAYGAMHRTKVQRRAARQRQTLRAHDRYPGAVGDHVPGDERIAFDSRAEHLDAEIGE